ncbi:MAG: 16S rRNA processing protein RimM [Ignavibacteriae bacterium]|nr:16S rRNA processing protein RimM [Ignavibacteriota bacterium]
MKPPNFEDEIVIGKIARSFGVKGYLKVIQLTDFPDRYKNLKSVHLYSETRKAFFDNSGIYEFDVDETQVTPDLIKLKLKGIDSKTQSDLLRNYLVTIPLDKRVKRNKGEFYYYELINCEVYDDGNLIGKVIMVENFGGDDLLKIKLEGKETDVYIPYRDEFIKKVDKSKKRIDVKLIEGLIE